MSIQPALTYKDKYMLESFVNMRMADHANSDSVPVWPSPSWLYGNHQSSVDGS